MLISFKTKKYSAFTPYRLVKYAQELPGLRHTFHVCLSYKYIFPRFVSSFYKLYFCNNDACIYIAFQSNVNTISLISLVSLPSSKCALYRSFRIQFGWIRGSRQSLNQAKILFNFRVHLLNGPFRACPDLASGGCKPNCRF